MAPSFYNDKTNQPYISKNFPHLQGLFQKHIKIIRKKLRETRTGPYTIRPKVKVLGEGEYAVVARISSDDVVMKIMDYDDHFVHESHMLKYMNKHRKKARNPLAPRFYKAFSIEHEIGIILMDNIESVYANYTDLYTYKPQHYKLLQRTLKRLHDFGVHHGDLKPEHIYIYTYPNDKYKMCFIDYGLSNRTEDESRGIEDKLRMNMIRSHC